MNLPQDPYHDVGQAHGAFKIRSLTYLVNKSIDPSLTRAVFFRACAYETSSISKKYLQATSNRYSRILDTYIRVFP